MKNLLYFITNLLFLLPSFLYSQADTLFGPAKFSREGGSRIPYVRNFSVVHLSPDPFKFVLLNGNSEMDSAVSSAVVKLNGEVIISQNDLNQNIYRIDREVYLLQNNILEVRLTSKPSSYITIFIYTDTRVITDTAAPQLSVITPPEGTLTADDRISVAGTVTDESPLELKINSELTEVFPGGSFSKEILLTEGINLITVAAEDSAGNTSSVTRSVRRYSTPPLIIISEPEDGLITGNLTRLVKGTVTDSIDFSLYINSQLVMPDSAGIFEDTVNLLEGENIIEVYAENILGLRSTRVIRVNADTTPPLIGYEFSYFRTVLRVSGSVSDMNEVFFRINGEITPVNSDGTFQVSYFFPGGEISFIFEAEDIAGNRSRIETMYSTGTKAGAKTRITPLHNFRSE